MHAETNSPKSARRGRPKHGNPQSRVLRPAGAAVVLVFTVRSAHRADHHPGGVDASERTPNHDGRRGHGGRFGPSGNRHRTNTIPVSSPACIGHLERTPFDGPPSRRPKCERLHDRPLRWCCRFGHGGDNDVDRRSLDTRKPVTASRPITHSRRCRERERICPSSGDRFRIEATNAGFWRGVSTTQPPG
jgi:hypothetical protein